MKTRSTHVITLILFIILCWETLVRLPVALISPAAAQTSPKPPSDDNQELVKLFKKDQADRTSENGFPIDWRVVSKRDRKREARVKELYNDDKLVTGADYFHAALVLQHSQTADDYLLAHEFCIVAISKGEPQAKWLAAATEDRFLMNIKRPQRFGTQFKSDTLDGPAKLYKVDSAVTDSLRRALDVPTLAEAKEREAAMGKPPQKKE